MAVSGVKEVIGKEERFFLFLGKAPRRYIGIPQSYEFRAMMLIRSFRGDQCLLSQVVQHAGNSGRDVNILYL